MSRKNKIEQFIDALEITDAGAEGKALGRWNDKVVFVPFAVPGDVLKVRVVRNKHSFMEARIVEILSPSPKRIAPTCEHYGLCGGCKWQNMNYPAQLFYKQKLVVDNLERIGKLSLPEISPILGSEDIYAYRNKMEYTFSDRRWLAEEDMPLAAEGKVNTNGCGFHLPSMFDKILDIQHCYLQDSIGDDIRLAAKKYAEEHNMPFWNPRAQTGLMRNLIIRNTSTGDLMVIVVFACNGDKNTALLQYLADTFPQISSLMFIINEKANDSITDLPVQLFKGENYITEQMEDLRFKVGPVSFFQTNTKQACALYDVVRNFAELTGNEIVYDLYTGTGTIANFVAKKAKKVVGIEYVPSAIKDAEENSAFNGIDNTVFYAGDMAKVLTASFIQDNGIPDVIITDPPRAGMHPDVVAQLLAVRPRTIVYVSCNPATQARDVAMMTECYTITKVQPVDMFPHTQHVENVMQLTRK